MSRIQRAITGLAMSVGLLVFVSPAALAACDSSLTLTNGINCASNSGSGFLTGNLGGLFGTISKVLIFVVGALSIIMIIIGGLRYVLSGGSSTATAGAKDTILYAVIGLVVAAAAFAIVSFVQGRLGL